MYIVIYSGDLNNELVWFSNGPKQLVPQMVHYLGHVLNSKLKVRSQIVKSLVTEWHLVTELFTMVTNQMVLTPDHSISHHLNTEQVKVGYSDKFAFQISAI